MSRIVYYAIAACISFAAGANAGEPVTVELDAVRDAGFFNQNTNRNMGAHSHVPVGQTNDGRVNRSIFDFDIRKRPTVPYCLWLTACGKVIRF